MSLRPYSDVSELELGEIPYVYREGIGYAVRSYSALHCLALAANNLQLAIWRSSAIRRGGSCFPREVRAAMRRSRRKAARAAVAAVCQAQLALRVGLIC